MDHARRRARGRPRSWDEREANVVKSVDRAMRVLATLARLETASLSRLAAETGEPAASVYRVLVTLRTHGVVEADDADQSWRVGAGAFLIGSSFLRRSSLVEQARPVMRSLMERSGETANLGVRDGDNVLFVSQVETNAPIRAFFPPGTRAHLHASGIGKVLLAAMPRARLEAALAGPLAGFTGHTIIDPVLLKADLERIAACGWALDDEESAEGMRCIAAPVRDLHCEVAAGLSISGPTVRFAAGRVEALAAMVLEAAADLSSRMGART